MGSDPLAGNPLGRPAWALSSPLLQEYYDTEWGMPVTTETGIFERLSLECFQSGLSWATILRKRDAFRREFAGFDPEKVAAFTAEDTERLMGCADIVRNRRKIEATINNAQAALRLREKGGLGAFVWSRQPDWTPVPRTLEEIPTQTPESAALSKDLKKEGFQFVGPTTMFALMEAIGLVDTHLVTSVRRGSSGLWGPSGERLSAESLRLTT